MVCRKLDSPILSFMRVRATCFLHNCWLLSLGLTTSTETVGVNGEIARLTSLEPSDVKDSSQIANTEKQEADRKRKREDVADGTAPVQKIETNEQEAAEPLTQKPELSTSNDDHPEKTPSIKWDELLTGLKEIVSDAKAQQVIAFLKSVNEGSSAPDGPTFVELDKTADKDGRRKIHQWVREQLGFCASSDTADGVIRVWHKKFRSKMPNDLDNNNNRGNSRGRNAGNRHSNNTKLVRFVLYKENMDSGSAMQSLTRYLGRQVRLGYAGNKDKRGITTQFITAKVNDPDDIYRSVNRETQGNQTGGGHTKTAGLSFMRAGHVEPTSDEIRLGSLQGNRFDIALRNVIASDPVKSMKEAVESVRETGFINYFGMQRFGKFCDTHKTGMAVVRGDYEAAVNIIMQAKEGEREDVIRGREIWANRFRDNPENRASSERRCAKQALKLINRFMHSESAILKSLAQKPLDYKRAFDSITKTMKMMFLHAVQSLLWNKVASFRIEKFGRIVTKGDLVLDSSSETQSRSRAPKVKVVTEEDIAASRYTIEDVVLPMIGADTRDPENECSKAFDDAFLGASITRENLCNIRDRDLNCAGDYRKLICRPTDVDYEVIRYKDELQPLIETDYMKIKGITIETNEGMTTIWGMRVGFSLPSSSYATIFLRELMRRPTSSSYQRTLGLGNEDVKTDNDLLSTNDAV